MVISSLSATFLQYLELGVVSYESHDNWPGVDAFLPDSMRPAYVTHGDI